MRNRFLSAFLPLIPLLLTASAYAATAEEPVPAGNPPALSDTDKAALRAQAEQHSAAGLKAMTASDNDSNQAVEAALEMGQALKLYQKLGDIDAVCETRANIYWCKKRMNLDEVQKYVASKGKDASATFASASEAADEKIPLAEADAYFARAEKFAKDNVDKTLLISAQYLFVAERFAGSAVAVKAQKISLETQQKWVQQQKAEIEADKNRIRDTRFTKPPQVTGNGTKSTVPDAAAAATALTAIKALYKDDYAKKRPVQKCRFARKLVDDADKSKDDAANYYVMLSEAQRLVLEGEDYDFYLTVTDTIAANFTSVDAAAVKRQQLSQNKSKPVAAAILKLLETPTDPGANTVAGKMFGVERGKWELALPMLALSNEPALKKVAEMELGDPKDPTEQSLTGEAWYLLAKKAGMQAEKDGMNVRALFWYSKAVDGLKGVNKDKAQKRVEELDKLVPLTVVDYNNLTANQWTKLKAITTVAVDARTARTSSGYVLKNGVKVRVVPHPTDTWKITTEFYGEMTATWKGIQPQKRKNSNSDVSYYIGWGGKYSLGSMAFQVGDSANIQEAGILEGQGVIYAMPYADSWSFSSASGIIRLKLCAVSDDD